MGKLTNVRERVHQPFYDTLLRTAGMGGTSPRVEDREELFTNRARAGQLSMMTNFGSSSALPSDQSHVTLALRVFLWFRAATVRSAEDAAVLLENGDFSQAGATNFFVAGAAGAEGIHDD